MEIFSLKLEKLLIFQARTSQDRKTNIPYIFFYKEAKFSKLEYFLIL